MDVSSVFRMSSGAEYVKEPRGIIPQLIDGLIAERAEKRKLGLKDEERVVKEFTLTFYGQLASPQSRIYEPVIGQDITGTAQEHVKWNKKFLEGIDEKLTGKRLKVLYGDTDSNHTKYPDELPYEMVKELAEAHCLQLNGTLGNFAAQYGAEEHFLSVKVEHVYNTFLQTGSKKQYAAIYEDPEGEIHHEGKRYRLKIRGFENRRSNSAPITKSLQKDLLIRILLEGSADASITKLQQFVASTLAGEEDPLQFGIAQTWKQEHYASDTQHVRAAKWSNENLNANFRQFSKPVLYFGHVTGKPMTDVFALEWGEPLPPGAVINWRKTVIRTVISPIADILDVVGVKPEDLLNPVHQVEEYF